MDMTTCMNVSSDTIWFLPFSSPEASWRFFPYQVRFTFQILSPFPCQTLSGPKCIALNLGSPLWVSKGPISKNCSNPCWGTFDSNRSNSFAWCWRPVTTEWSLLPCHVPNSTLEWHTVWYNMITTNDKLTAKKYIHLLQLLSVILI